MRMEAGERGWRLGNEDGGNEDEGLGTWIEPGH